MKKTILTIMVICLVATPLAFAQTDAQKALAEKFLLATNADKMLEDYKSQMQEKQASILASIPEDSEDRAKFMTLQDLIDKEMTWDNMKGDVIDAYANMFTEDDLNGLIAFYTSPLGEKFISKQPELIQQSMESTQKMMDGIMQKFMAMQQEQAADTQVENAETEPAPAE